MPDNDKHDAPVYSAGDNPLSTRSIGGQPDAPLAQPRHTGPLDIGLSAPWVVELHLYGTTLSYRLEAEQRLLMGRADGNIQPELDLTSFQGMDHGVSRRHAVLVATGDRLEIIDLRSTNGTFINEHRAQPFKPYRVRQGDELRLGQISMVLTLDVVPVHLSPRWHQPWVRRRSIITAAGHGQRVLIVEPGPETGATLKAILEGLDYSVQVVATLADAFYAATVRLPDVLVLTLALEADDGLEISRNIQRLTARQHIPVIAISRDTSPARAEAIMNAGADVFLGKPIGVDELVRAVATVTQGAGQPGGDRPLMDEPPHPLNDVRPS